MFKRLLGKSETTRGDLFMALAMAATTVWKAIDTYRDYKADQQKKELPQ